MPRIIFVFLFVILTVAPFLVVKVAEIVLNVSKPVETVDTTKTTGNTGYQNGYYNRPHYGSFFYFGSSGRGGWLGRSYRNTMPSGSSSSSGFFGKSRSYSGGSSSFKGGGFGSFGK